MPKAPQARLCALDALTVRMLPVTQTGEIILQLMVGSTVQFAQAAEAATTAPCVL
jgi:hypothetical protein